MDRQDIGYGTRRLWALILVGITYSSFLCFQGRFIEADANTVEGIIGVVFGLYICSHPAGHLVDLLFFRRSRQRPFSSNRSAALWVALNALALLIGWAVIFSGTTRLVGRGG